MTILVTGASGFIGSFIVSEGLNLGHQMWAGIRGTSSREYLTDERIQFALLDLGNPEKLRTQLFQYREKLGGHGWDYVVHAAGATKCLHREDFFRTNTEGTQNLIEALRATNMIPQRFIFISSLSVFGAIREKPVRKASPDNPWIYSPILLTDTPQPNTAYGQSKLQAEEFLQNQKDIPYTILRPTGVYGPREKDYFLMAQSIKQHTDFSVGYKAQEITFVYMMDVVQAVFRCMDSPAALNHAYFLSDGHIYNSRHFSDLLQQEMGNPWVLHIKAPLWFLRIICWISGHLSQLTGKMNALNEDKYHILRQRNWQCDIGPAQRDFGYDPQWPLERGVKAAVKWYRENHWL
ncbi:MAG: NAD(P)-dependent oxidoreductase [Bacteroidaceae bacterium]|nr:NAD(P)-dependent oxidoreductase [Bacteroidaceae bacterium]MBQ6050373.1 NAD(P)-dependent oxidoreductase [Bacteroidaceae bacterium]